MLFEDWLDQRWGISENDFPEWINLMSIEKEKTNTQIRDQFSNKPKFVINISKDVFMSLPRKSNDVIPDFSVVTEWLKKNTKNEYYKFDVTTYIFSDESDAMAFKLRWS